MHLLTPTASHSLRSFVKPKLEYVGQNADGEWEIETAIIIKKTKTNLSICFCMGKSILYSLHTIMKRYWSERCTAAQLSLELGMNVFITHCCRIPNGDNLKRWS